MEKPKKTKAELCFEKYISDPKLEKPWKDTILYAKTRWELLRRNNVFRKEFIKKIEEVRSGAFVDEHDLPQWNLSVAWSFSLDDSFEEHIFSRAKDSKKTHGAKDRKSYESTLYLYSQNLLPNNPVVSVLNSLHEIERSNYLNVSINLTFSKFKIMQEVENYVYMFQTDVAKEAKPKKARVKHHYDLYPKYLAVYDMKENDKLPYRKIARKIFPEYYDPDYEEDHPECNPENANAKVLQYYKEAKRLIENVAYF